MLARPQCRSLWPVCKIRLSPAKGFLYGNWFRIEYQFLGNSLVTMTEPSAHLLGEIGLDPSWSHTIDVPSHDGQSHRWHYLERAGTSDSTPTILCLHGNPTWSFLWSRLINEMSNEYRIIAPDHLSMGYSDHNHRANHGSCRFREL